MSITTHTPDPTDIHVGAIVRRRRRWLGYSQTQLAQALGITFQQVQKYERGANRVSASMLLRIARKLEVTVGFFYEGLEGPAAGLTADDMRIRAFMQDHRMTSLAQKLEAFPEAARKSAFAALQGMVTSLREIGGLPETGGSGQE